MKRAVNLSLCFVLALTCIAAVACSSSRMTQDITASVHPQAPAADDPRAEYEAAMHRANQALSDKQYQSAFDEVLAARTHLNNARQAFGQPEYNERVARAASLQNAVLEQQRLDETIARAAVADMRWRAESQNEIQADSFIDPTVIGAWENNPDDLNPTITVNPNDEIWVIVKPAAPEPDAEADNNQDNHPGGGAMLALIPVKPAGDEEPSEQVERLPLPLKHTAVHASVAGYIATVDVTQQFHNPFEKKIEAVYQFPLPQDAAVSGFVMTIGDRQIHGVIREKEEAEQLYRAARAQGLRASILTQVRPNIFEQKVANIEPGKRIDVSLRYFNTLSYSDGWYTFAFPMVVGPRYNPPYSENPVTPVARGAVRGPAAPGADGMDEDERGGGGFSPPANPDDQTETQIQYLRPTERSGHDISLTLDIDAGVGIEASRSLTHVVNTTATGENKLTVELSHNDALPNKDFVFAFKVAGEQMKSGLVTHVDENGKGYFTLMLYPPAELTNLDRQPMEMVFVLDCSGSMRGEPMRQAKDAAKRALRRLNANDTFQLIRFSNSASYFGDEPVPATPANIDRAIAYLDTLEGSGGTEMIEGIMAALDFPHDPQRFRTVAFLTDGFIGNETEILAAIEPRLGNARVFSFGVGSSVNRYLLERMAAMGRGAAAYLLPDQSGAEVMDLYFDRVSRPAMTDLTIDWGEVEVSGVYPQRLPDLFVGRPVVVTGRFDPAGAGFDRVVVTGRAGAEQIALSLNTSKDATAHDALAQVWARRRIAELMDQVTVTADTDGQAALEADILATALDYQLMSAYTAFLAVDASETTPGDAATTIAQPVPVPEGVDYDTTVNH